MPRDYTAEHGVFEIIMIVVAWRREVDFGGDSTSSRILIGCLPFTIICSFLCFIYLFASISREISPSTFFHHLLTSGDYHT